MKTVINTVEETLRGFCNENGFQLQVKTVFNIEIFGPRGRSGRRDSLRLETGALKDEGHSYCGYRFAFLRQ
ncbi:hypothetical protein DN745_14165 [Bradymonas sediminis]|uniref:Uncharacterized protein n=1 Tax=Bradymonas sediminis TaxID=1548548 RepID=A0A2Z4FN38_9DELT|nr:hypothetical protein DN745_14165 [Bradymonas sediminis]